MGGEYDLPAGEVSTGPTFGQMTGQRFEIIEQTAGPGEYDLPEGEVSTVVPTFGQMTGERFEIIKQTPGVKYDLPTVKVVNSAGFSTTRRLVDYRNSIVGPGHYDTPKSKSVARNAKFPKASRGLTKRRTRRCKKHRSQWRRLGF